ncbi:MAG TPA: elongation factor P maturation arginine rhamnosyltransferase EarP [Rhodocyclaceae bacterium]|nr:elongation factor P maturation arginine rhamnosyltransferase EarP [Rhodocyclaceae bacterium]
MHQAPPTCDIFCRVIDNYGDIGVCWRLARQLQEEYGWQMRLWVDELSVFKQLAREPGGVDVRAWEAPFPQVTPAEIVIEAFACELPENYLSAMAQASTKPTWINLEYLSVEDWSSGFHGQPSPHPRLPLTKHFFFPGVLPGNGGTLCEHDLLARRDSFDITAARLHYTTKPEGLWTFLFCYDNPALPFLLNSWAASERPVHCLIAAGKAHEQVSRWLGKPIIPGLVQQSGQLSLYALPFVAQSEFDKFLWMSDLNFVRGEDSFCRAQWAALPFIWQIYPQAGEAHHLKLDTFYRHYDFGLTPSSQTALDSFSVLWNGMAPSTQESTTTAWRQLSAALPTLHAQAISWQKQLAQQGNLAENLAIFCKRL